MQSISPPDGLKISKAYLLFCLLALALLLPGCRLGYLIQAGTGQFKLLYHSVEIEKALAGGTLKDEQRDRLLLVDRLKAFGETELGLKETGNYQKVYLESNQPPIYLVSACPRDRLEKKTWWFPAVGPMPYLGFFDLEKARAEEKKLRQQGLDVFLGRAEAYSTLGWFKDPVTMNLLEGSTNALAETILHEMTHVTLYLKGQSEFNEGLAVMVGMYGALSFFRENFGESHPYSLEAQKAIDDEIVFSQFLNQLLDQLGKLYASPFEYDEKLKQREAVYKEAMKQYHELAGRFQTERFKHFERSSINNAYLMTIGLYHRHFTLFHNLLESDNYSIKDAIPLIEKIVKNEEDPVGGLRDWLARETGT